MPVDPEPVFIIEGGGAGPRRPCERKCNRMEAQVMTSKMQERKAEAAEFLIDARRLPPELRWKIQGKQHGGVNPRRAERGLIYG